MSLRNLQHVRMLHEAGKDKCCHANVSPVTANMPECYRQGRKCKLRACARCRVHEETNVSPVTANMPECYQAGPQMQAKSLEHESS